jgi:thiol:disulfide interchange protein
MGSTIIEITEKQEEEEASKKPREIHTGTYVCLLPGVLTGPDPVLLVYVGRTTFSHNTLTLIGIPKALPLLTLGVGCHKVLPRP